MRPQLWPLVILYSGLLLAGLPLPIWLLFQGQSWVGRGLGVLGVALFLTPILLFQAWRTPQPGLWRAPHPDQRRRLV